MNEPNATSAPEQSSELDYALAMLLGTAPASELRRWFGEDPDAEELDEETDGTWAREFFQKYARAPEMSAASPSSAAARVSALECAEDFLEGSQPAARHKVVIDAATREAVRELLADGVLRSQRQILGQLQQRATPTTVKAVLRAGLAEGWLLIEDGPRRAHLHRLATPACG